MVSIRTTDVLFRIFLDIKGAWRREGKIFLDQPGVPETPLAEGKDVAISFGLEGTHLVWSTPQGNRPRIP